MLHFIGDFFYTPALVLHVLHLKGIFLIIKGNFLQKFLPFNFFPREISCKKFLKGFFVKLKVSSILGENGEKSNSREFPLKGALYPRASLARAALERDFLYNHGGRRSITGTA